MSPLPAYGGPAPARGAQCAGISGCAGVARHLGDPFLRELSDPDEQRVLCSPGMQHQEGFHPREVFRSSAERPPVRVMVGTDVGVADIRILDAEREVIHADRLPGRTRVAAEIAVPRQGECRTVLLDEVLRTDAAVVDPMRRKLRCRGRLRGHERLGQVLASVERFELIRRGVGRPAAGLVNHDRLHVSDAITPMAKVTLRPVPGRIRRRRIGRGLRHRRRCWMVHPSDALQGHDARSDLLIEKSPQTLQQFGRHAISSPPALRSSSILFSMPAHPAAGPHLLTLSTSAGPCTCGEFRSRAFWVSTRRT